MDCSFDSTEGGGFCVLQWSAARSHPAGFGTAAAIFSRAGCPRFRRPDAACGPRMHYMMNFQEIHTEFTYIYIINHKISYGIHWYTLFKS